MAPAARLKVTDKGLAVDQPPGRGAKKGEEYEPEASLPDDLGIESATTPYQESTMRSISYAALGEHLTTTNLSPALTWQAERSSSSSTGPPV